MTAVLALSLSSEIEKYGAYAGIAAVVGLGVLSLLYFAQAREVKRLREWAGRAPERDAELQDRVTSQAAVRAATPPAPAPARPAPAGPATPAAAAAAAAAAAKPAAATAAHPGTPTGAKPPAPKPAAPATAAATAASAATAATAAGTATPSTAGPAAAPDKPVVATPPAAVPATAVAGTPPAAVQPPPDKPAAPAVPAAAAAAAKPAPSASPTTASPEAAPAAPAAAPVSPPAPAPRAAPAPAPARQRPRPAAAPVRATRPDMPAARDIGNPPPRTGSRRGLVGVVVGGIAIAAIAVLLITQVFSGGDSGPTKPNTVGTPTTQAGQDAATRPQPKRATTQVAVFNGTTVAGLARAAADKLTAAGYKNIGPVTNDTSNQARAATVVYWQSGSRREGVDVARILGLSKASLAVMDQNARVLGGGAPVVVIVGADQAR